MSFKKQFYRNILVSGGYTFSIQFVGFIASFITSRLLLPADFGLVGLIAVFSNFISIFSDGGISLAVIRSKYQHTFYRGLNALSILIGILLCAILIILIYPVAIFYHNFNVVMPGIAISLLFIVRSVNIVPIAVLQKKLQFNTAGKALLTGALLGTIGAIIMAFAGLKYWSLIWSQFITSLTTTFLLYRKTGFKDFIVRKPVLVKSFQLAKKLIGSLMGFNMINYWARNADNLIVGKYYSASSLGIYNRAYMMLMLPLNLITGVFSSVLLPSLVKHKKEGGDVELEYYFILKLISLLNLPVAIILILFPESFVRILWGENWLDVAKLLPYFGLLVMTQTLISTLGNLLIVENKEKILKYSGWVSAIFVVAGIIVGATISLTAIAAFYALSYIVLVLPFNIIYVFKNNLKFVSGIVSFWIPKILLSLVLWIAIYNSLVTLLLPVLLLWIALIIWDARAELKKARRLLLAAINL